MVNFRVPINCCALTVGLLLLAGCGGSSFFGARYDNFSAYYNKYYNAERALEEGIEAFEQALERSPIDQDVFLSMFGRSQQATTQRKPFEDAIMKSADIVREHPDSKWIDDAILIIGKAWFFTLNFVGAQEKFQEILAIDSPLHDEARFWLARTYIAGGEYDEAFSHLQATLSAENVSRRWEPRYRLALAELYVQRENWVDGAAELERGLDRIQDRALAGRALFLLGQVYEQLGQYEDAVAAYNRVQDYKPFYELSYAAQYSAVRVLADHVDADAALQGLRRMERDDKNYDHRANLAYLRGRVLIAQGQYDAALDIYDELLYDQTAGGRQLRGPIHYTLGIFYRDTYSDFPYAAAHFDTAQRSLGSRAFGTRRARERAKPAPSAITDSEEQARVFGDFADILDQILHMDSLLYLGSLDDSSFKAVEMELRRQRAAEIAESERRMAKRQIENQFRGDGGAVLNQSEQDLEQEDFGSAEAGFLFHRDPVRLLQAHQDFVQIWGERPRAPNWRRLAAIEAVAAEVDAKEGGGTDIGSESTLESTLPEVDMSAVPRDEESWAAMLNDRAMAWYELANALFLSMNMPDSAAVWYRMVIEENDHAPVAQRAYYALAEVQRALGDTLAAQRLYEVIVDRFPQSEFVHNAYERLGQPVPEGLLTDSLELAERAYLIQQEHFRQGAYDSVLTGMIDLALTWPTTEVAPRALLQAGRAYMAWTARDSLDLFGELPVTLPDSVLVDTGFLESPDDSTASDTTLTLSTLLGFISSRYEQAPHADQATRIITVLGERQAAIRAHADSLARADSLALVASLARADSLAYADSLAASMPDSLAPAQAETPVDTLVVAESESEVSVPEDAAAHPDSIKAVSRPEPAPDFPAGPRRQPVVDTQGAPEPQDPGLGNLDWSQGGYTIVLETYKQHAMAVAFVNNFQHSIADIPHAMDIMGAETAEGVEFRVGLGLFETLQDAEAVRQRLEGRIPAQARIVRVTGQPE